MNYIKNKILFFLTFIVIFSGFFIFSQSFSLAGPAKTGYGLNKTTSITGIAIPKEKNIPAKIGAIIGAVLSFVGILFFVLIIYAGFLWMTARGNEEQVKKAIELITQAAIGLAIISSAYLVTKFIGETLFTMTKG